MRYVYYSKLRHSVDGTEHLQPASQSVYNPHKYGLPELKKFPMPDAAHVKSAIKFFNYVSPKDEKKLAQAILNRMKEYGVTDVNVGPNNRFSKYYKSDNVLQHSTGPWEKHQYRSKIQMPDGTWRYDYGNGDPSAIGSRLNGGEMTGNNANMHSNNQGVSQTPSHEKAVKQQKSLEDFKNKPVSEVIGNNAPKYNQGIVGGSKNEDDKSTDSTTDSKTTDKTTGTKGKGGSGKKGSGSKKSSSGSGKSSSSGKASPGKASGGSKKSGSGGSGSSSSGTDDAAAKKAAKEAKKQQAAQKDYQKELQKMKEENKRKQDEQFEQRRRENEKRWKAEEERMEQMRDTSRQSVSKETLNDIIEMLKDSDKEYAKKLLEGGRSKIDDYLDWLKESRKNNQSK